jgi:hypothetical protein
MEGATLLLTKLAKSKVEMMVEWVLTYAKEFKLMYSSRSNVVFFVNGFTTLLPTLL